MLTYSNALGASNNMGKDLSLLWEERPYIP